ncbi:MAG: four helix bundle protein [Oscillospiraceae bacterium]|nr:four helix bundle protein [Oscillospiraceae bacterium]
MRQRALFACNQLERSATSIGANIHEANYAYSRSDFAAKLQIALKECYETEYWLELFVRSELFTEATAPGSYPPMRYDPLASDCVP